MSAQAQPFAAVLESDPQHLKPLRAGLAAWLAGTGITGPVRDDVVFAAHEAAASAMSSPGDVLVDVTLEGDLILVIVASDDGWKGPDEDVEGQRIRLLRESMSNVSFETLSGRASLRMERKLSD